MVYRGTDNNLMVRLKSRDPNSMIACNLAEL